MSQLKLQIEKKKRSIRQKKHHIESDIEEAKKRLVSAATISVSALSGFLIGYFLIPSKLVKILLRTLTVASTAKSVIDVLPHSSSAPTKKRKQIPK